MGNEEKNLDFFVVGGALPPDSPSYIERPTDDELLNSILAHHFCCILAKHGMGKSSLMVRTAWRLQQQGISTATLVMSGVTAEISIEQLSLWLIKRLKVQLNLSIDPHAWWVNQTHHDGGRPLIDFLKNVVLSEVGGPIVIFIDEVNDTTVHQEFFDGLFTAIQFIYDASAKEAVYNRLSFVLLGTIMPADLAKNHNQALFSTSRSIALREFSRAELQLFEQGMQAAGSEQWEAILDRVFHWTSGHPYLTQKLCLAMVSNPHWNDAWVDQLTYQLFSSTKIRTEFNLNFVSESVMLSPRRRALLTLYRHVYQDKSVPEDMNSRDQRQLKFVGLVKSEKGTLKIHNEIYRRVFDADWINANMPINWARYIVVTSIIVAILLAGIITISVYQQRQAATQVELLIENFRRTTSPDERLVSLAELFNVGGYEDQARTLFYEELSPADQLALFDLADPHAVGQQVITVVEGVYADSALKNDEQSAALLDMMANTLAPLESTPSLGAIELRLEIVQWLRGRDYSQNQEKYREAIVAYNVAMQFNDQNPGTFFDRALAYASLGEPSQALTDFEMVLSLDESWHTRIEEILVSDSQLYMALWNEQGEYGTLVAFVPTPTNTPTSTNTPISTATPTSSPTPLPTNTPLPSTSTATATSTPTPTTTATPTSGIATPTPKATLTPTPSIPTGTFTLLNPLSSDDPSYGPTDFEWEWTGSVPPGYGFEVRAWREGEFPAGVHDALLDNQNGNIKTISNNRYRLSVDISGAAGILGRSGEYLWTVALVQISPSYAELGQQAEPGHFRYAAPGRSGDSDSGSDGGSGGGGGVGID